MNILDELKSRWNGVESPFLIHPNGELSFKDIARQQQLDISDIRAGDVVALIGDFDPQSILTLLRLIDKRAIVVPLTVETKAEHEYFFDAALVDFVVETDKVQRRHHSIKNESLELLRSKSHAGLVLFSTGTTGRPKAILHDLTVFMKRFETPRPTLRTISFLLFDHIGGLNTLFHTLFNKGTVVAPLSRSAADILDACRKYQIEVLPTTPTFLRMMLMSGLVPNSVPDSLRIITYGTERMDQPTLDALCELLPTVEFRQTFGMSELGIVRVKSESRDSLYMKIGGEGVETRVVEGVLEIRSEARMIGYLNEDSPFDNDGWYSTGDCVEERNGFYKVTGRKREVINVGGLKFMASEVERAALQFENVELAKVDAVSNPITGQHVELTVQPIEGAVLNKGALAGLLKEKLLPHMVPRRIKIASVGVGHRFKRV